MIVVLFFAFVVSCVQSLSTGTVYFKNGKYDFVMNKLDSNGVAFCSFNDMSTKTGWNSLEVTTNANFTNQQQARAAGVCEGALTVQQIDFAWINGDFPMQLDPKVLAFIARNWVWMDRQVLLIRQVRRKQGIDDFLFVLRFMQTQTTNTGNKLKLRANKFTVFTMDIICTATTLK